MMKQFLLNNIFTRHLQKAVTEQNFVYEYLVGNP